MRRKIDLLLTIKEFAERLGPQVLDIRNDGAGTISGFNTLEEASPTDAAFVATQQHAGAALASKAGAFIIPAEVTIEGRACIVVKDVQKAVLTVLNLFYPDQKRPAGIHPTAVIDPTVHIGQGVYIGPLTVVEENVEIGDGVEIGAQCFIARDARIGAGSLLYAGVRVLERVQVGRGVILHCGVVLGADGFGYKLIDGIPTKIPQVGTVVLEDGVEIGANTCIDRAALSETRIGMGSKIDNLVQIGHNCRIGRSCFFAAQVGVSGSTQVGDGSIFWGQVGVADHLKIGSMVQLLAQSGVKDDVPDGVHAFGTPALPVLESARLIAGQKRIPDILKRLRALEKKVGE